MCQNVPEIECGLNDLTENDFNTSFKLVPSFLDKQAKEKCFVSGVPGSFYSRLFPSQSLHFVHSSFSVHWLSKFPDGLKNNTKSIHINHTCPPNVFKSYSNQFKNDFSLFLKMRSEETVPSKCLQELAVRYDHASSWTSRMSSTLFGGRETVDFMPMALTARWSCSGRSTDHFGTFSWLAYPISDAVVFLSNGLGLPSMPLS
ncbi:hypothetical protein DY000_02055819 [Brassica cretica]|uniref:Uncharacterized protein n=1 Tax=Brassica cretica TaxID=69181 RepID=A0ABQ7AGL5_BRACR|nr:hypothetical protein DY000_02055819 [Brassica cretica]